ncbi:discoidin, CUB and LCCL domain-containing protein 1 [Nothobranchius furzeri]|uniref:discoidin, CUB and LCCL domain-containing protein 1 n=1 Tax=Nothobranchius furzeri TaxID=105023 RepID=UPI003904C3EC
MLGKCRNIRHEVKSFISGFWITVSVCSVGIYGQKGNSCGHTVLGAESGTLASQNYPGTYPSNSRCEWRLRVPEGRTLRLLFGDFDIESSPGCGNGSVTITDRAGNVVMGPVCGKLNTAQKNLTIESNEVTVRFSSGPHHSGRGFLLSYATDKHPDFITCLQRGSHFSLQHLSVYCPAGCKNVTGDVWGNSEQGYRDTSVLCKSAVHAGATSDTSGGRVTVDRGRSLTLYESAFSNGILSKMGSLSEKKLLFSQECNNILRVSGLNASSYWDKTSQEHPMSSSSRSVESSHGFLLWTADTNDPNPWVELELAERSMITGLITMGSIENYIESCSLYFSKDGKTWKLYRDPQSKEKKVFQANADGHLRVLNSLFPVAIARFVRLQPLSWHGRAATRVRVLGCPASKATPRSRTFGAESSSFNISLDTQTPSPTEDSLLVKTQSTSQPVMVAVGVVLGLVMCGSLLAVVWWKRRKKVSHMKKSLPTGCQNFKAKGLSCPQPELICYPLQRNVHDALPAPPLNDYAAPVLTAGGKKVGSTFRPSSDEGYTTPFTTIHYDTPGSLPEYAEPLPPEPEYATPFSELPAEPKPPTLTGIIHSDALRPHVPAASTISMTTPSQSPYDCPSHRVLFNGYCTPALHCSGPQLVTEVYAEPKPSDSLLQKHTYEEPL